MARMCYARLGPKLFVSQRLTIGHAGGSAFSYIVPEFPTQAAGGG